MTENGYFTLGSLWSYRGLSRSFAAGANYQNGKSTESNVIDNSLQFDLQTQMREQEAQKGIIWISFEFFAVRFALFFSFFIWFE